MKKQFTFFVFILWIVVPAGVFGQPYIDLLSIQKNWYNKAVYKNDPNATLNQAVSNVNMVFPVVFKNGNILLLGIDYLENSFSYKSDTSYHAYLESQCVNLGFVKKWTGTPWSTTFLVFPRVASRLKNSESSDYQLGGVVLATYKKRNSLKFKFGVYYNREFYGNSVLPLLGIDWKMTDRMYMYGVLPGSMNIEYRLTDRFYTGLAYRNCTYTYRAKNEPDDYYVLDGSDGLGNNHLYTFIHAYPMKNLVVYAGAGITLFHEYQMYGPGDKKIRITSASHKVFNEAKDGTFFQLGVAFRMRRDKEYSDITSGQ